MRGKLAFTAAISAAACSSPPAEAGGAGVNVLPKDVAAFVERREQCDHFRGEEPYDEARATELRARLEKACKGTDAELARLRARYARDASVRARLANYEDKVE